MNEALVSEGQIIEGRFNGGSNGPVPLAVHHQEPGYYSLRPLSRPSYTILRVPEDILKRGGLISRTMRIIPIDSTGIDNS